MSEKIGRKIIGKLAAQRLVGAWQKQARGRNGFSYASIAQQILW
jgi:hypothetical protein